MLTLNLRQWFLIRLQDYVANHLLIRHSTLSLLSALRAISIMDAR